ncbi:MAG: hypothetical protein KF819_00580 [Labilithrix sp.]|nr:hypothetical protein [Labilithrix sp.]
MNARALAIAVVALAGCGSPPQPAQPAHAGAMLPDVRLAKDRPPVVLVSREGDPAGAIAIAVTTRALADGDDDAEPAVALAGLVERRLAARGLSPVVAPSWSGVRAVILVPGAAEAPAAADAAREALTGAADERDLAAAKRKLAALASRPLRDPALGRWARCVGSPHAEPRRAGKSGGDLTLARLEKWRESAHGLGRVAIAVAGPLAMGEAVASAIARGPAWRAAAPAGSAATRAGSIDADVYDASGDGSPQPVVYATLDVGTASHAVTTAEALGDAHGPLATRLAALDLPFRLREVTATADPRGGCVGVVLGAEPATTTAKDGDLAARVADAIALVHVEAQVHLTEGGAALDGRTLARRAGDAREAAERAAWWTLADAWMKDGDRRAPAMRGSVALGVPSRRGSAPDATLEPSREALGTAIQRALASWQKPVAEGRTRLEPGQGEAWVLLASPCGTESETDADGGLTALFAVAAAEQASRDAAHAHPQIAGTPRVEPWIVADGAGLLVHGPAMPGETPAAHARRLADVVGRSFAGGPIAAGPLARARAELLQRDAQSGGAALATLASAVAPGHASWFVPGGREETLARSADAAVIARAQALRAGPLRVAVLANVDASQGEAAVRAADRWIDRRSGETRACRGPTAAAGPRPGTYATAPRPGAAPEAWLAFPFTPGDDGARAAGSLLAAALDGEGGLLERALGAPGLARSWSARVVGSPRAPALVVRVVSTQAALDDAVMQVRALVDRVKKSGLAPAEHERASAALSRDAIASALDPRARVVALWRGDPIPSAAQPLPRGRAGVEDVRSFAARFLAEDAMVVVAARPGRAKTP